MSEAQSISAGLMAALAAQLLDRDARVVSAIAESNALNWGLVDYDITAAAFTDGAAAALRFEATLQIAGEQDADRPRAGDRFVVTVRGTAATQDGTWTLADYEVRDITDPSTASAPTWATDDPTAADGADLLRHPAPPRPPAAVDYPDDGDVSERAAREDEARVFEHRERAATRPA